MTSPSLLALKLVEPGLTALNSAGIAGINKNIAIADITQTQDITYAIYSLNTWVLTEMWFIIIFGSIPVLRPVFICFAQNIKTATLHPRERTCGTTNRNPNDTWVELNGKTQAGVTHESAHSKVSYDSQHGESEEEILPVPARAQISASRNATANRFFNSKAGSHQTSHAEKTSVSDGSNNLVPSNYGSTNTVVGHLPMEKSAAGKWQEVRREGSMDRQIQVMRNFAITYEDEDQTNES